MPIIQTRYRDIPLEQMRQCLKEGSPRFNVSWERECRGNPVLIEIPVTIDDPGAFICGGRRFRVAGMAPIIKDGRSYYFAVCEHHAEIGD